MAFVLSSPIRLSSTDIIPAGASGLRERYDEHHIMLIFNEQHEALHQWRNTLIVDRHDEEIMGAIEFRQRPNTFNPRKVLRFRVAVAAALVAGWLAIPHPAFLSKAHAAVVSKAVEIMFIPPSPFGY